MRAAVLSTVDKTDASEGITTLHVSYTGTTKEAEQAREDALHNELQVAPPCRPVAQASHSAWQEQGVWPVARCTLCSLDTVVL